MKKRFVLRLFVTLMQVTASLFVKNPKRKAAVEGVGVIVDAAIGPDPEPGREKE